MAAFAKPQIVSRKIIRTIYYKYLTIERTTYLKDKLLRFTQPGDLNNPFECRPQIPKFEDFHSVLNLFGEGFSKNGITVSQVIITSFTQKWFDKHLNEAHEFNVR